MALTSDDPPRLATSTRADTGKTAGLAVLVFLLTLGGLSVTFLPKDVSDIVILVILGFLAMFGIVSLFATMSGYVRIAASTPALALPSASNSALMGAIPEGALIADTDGVPLQANMRFLRIVGVKDPEDLKPVEQLLGSNPDAAEAIFRLATAAGQRRRASEEIRTPFGIDGRSETPRWYRVRVTPLKDGSGKDRSLWLIADITREREYQENIFQELQNAIDYLDHAPAGFFSIEADGRVRYLNATLAAWLGIDLAEFEPGTMSIKDMVSGEGLTLLKAVKAKAGELKTEVIDLDLVRSDDTRLPARLLHRVPVAANGKPGASRTIVLNATPLEGALEPGLRAEMRFNRLFNNTPIAIASIDRDGLLEQTNARFLTLFGSPEENGRFPDVVAEGDRAALSAAIEAAMAGQSDIPPVDAALAGDEERSVRVFANPVVDGDDDDRGGVVVYAMETTEQRALEIQFTQSQKMQAVGQLAGGIAHDFNNLLTAIIGFSDLLLANHRPTDPSFQDIMNIKQNATRAAGLVRQLLAFSRRQTLRPKEIELNAVLNDLSVLLDRLLGERVTLEIHHGRDLWPVKVDLNQFEQVVVNLAVNARDAMPDGGKLTIRTGNLSEADSKSLRYPGFINADYTMVEVSDTGVGMSPEIQEKIFEPFFSTKEVGKGTGLGLSTVYGIVKQTGGFVYVDSVEGVGTTFRLLLPRLHPDEKEEEEEQAGATGPTDLTGSASVLLVEDEEAVRAFAARALTARGYTVYEAATGVEALETLAEVGGKIDVVVSDVVMPEMDGPTLLIELRKNFPDIKIIFVSGYAEEAFAKNLPDDETFQFLPKPFTLKDLATAVKQTLAQ